MVAKALTVCVCALSAAWAAAQPVQKISLRAGYYFGAKFDGLAPGSRLDLNGPELGADLTLLRLPLTEVRLSPAVVFGGAGQSGSDADGEIYRVILNAKFKAPATDFYAAVGAGYAASQNRGGRQFDTKEGGVAQLTLGYEPPSRIPGAALFYEASYVFGHEQLSGLSLSVGVKF